VRLQQQYDLSAYDAGVIIRQGRAFTAYFEEVARLCGDAKAACNWMTNQVLATLNETKGERRGVSPPSSPAGIADIRSFPIQAPALAELIAEAKNTGLNLQRSREVYAEMLASRGSAKESIAKLGIKVVADEGQLREMVRRHIAANPKAVADFKKGKTKAADAIKGAVMRETKGMAKTELVQQILLEELART
jgi:aspartyl-tRNA(Asn)/glutamyl-tRNA(Gln) amidotransferase subunit B